MEKVGLLNSQFDKEQKGKERTDKGHLFFFIERFGENPHHQQLYIKYFNTRQLKYQM